MWHRIIHFLYISKYFWRDTNSQCQNSTLVISCNVCLWGMNLWIFRTLILVCEKSGDIFYSYNLINPPHSQKSSESQAKWNKQAWRKCSSTSLLHWSPLSIYKTDKLACHWLALNHETHMWVVTKKTSQGLWFSPLARSSFTCSSDGKWSCPSFP